MGELLIIYGTLLVISGLLLYLLLKTEDDKTKNRMAFLGNFVLVLVLSFMAYTEQPENYTLQRTIATLPALLGFVAVLIKFQADKNKDLARNLLIISLITGLALGIFI